MQRHTLYCGSAPFMRHREHTAERPVQAARDVGSPVSPRRVLSARPRARGDAGVRPSTSESRAVRMAQRMPSSISFTKPAIDWGVTTPAPVFRLKPGILYCAVITH